MSRKEISPKKTLPLISIESIGGEPILTEKINPFSTLPFEVQKILFSFFSFHNLNQLVCSCRSLRELIRGRFSRLYIQRSNFFHEDLKDKKMKISSESIENKFNEEAEKYKNIIEKTIEKNNVTHESVTSFIEKIKTNYGKYFLLSLRGRGNVILIPADYFEKLFLNSEIEEMFENLEVDAVDIGKFYSQQPKAFKKRETICDRLLIMYKVFFKIVFLSLIIAYFSVLFFYQGYGQKAQDITPASCDNAKINCSNFTECVSYFNIPPAFKNQPCSFSDSFHDQGTVFFIVFILSMLLGSIVELIFLGFRCCVGSEKKITKKLVLSSLPISTITALFFTASLPAMHRAIIEIGKGGACHEFCNVNSKNYLKEEITFPLFKPLYHTSLVGNTIIMFLIALALNIILDKKNIKLVCSYINIFLLKRKQKKNESTRPLTLEQLEEGLNIASKHGHPPAQKDIQDALVLLDSQKKENEGTPLLEKDKGKKGCWDWIANKIGFFNSPEGFEKSSAHLSDSDVSDSSFPIDSNPIKSSIN